MRLIDADALIDKFGDWYTEEGSEEGYIGTIKGIVGRMPTIERKTGKWNVYYHSETDFSYSCNQCGHSAPYGQYGGEYSQEKWRYCPNCGADMRGDKDG